jgi:Ca-activated chloride channel family protein
MLPRAAMRPAQTWRRHLPPLLFFLGVVAMLAAAARPSAVVALPSEQRTIVLAIDVSYSMAATDIAPSRLAAAQAAAKSFVRAQPRDVRIGIVAFAADADMVLRPTTSHGNVLAAIDELSLRYNTAIGNGLIASLMTIFPQQDIAGAYDIFGMGRSPLLAQRIARNQPPRTQRIAVRAVPPASFSSAAIILLTDGRETIGVPLERAAHMAADRGVRVYTVGFGSPGMTTVDIEGERMEVGFDEDALKTIAAETRGAYFHATSAEELSAVYRTLKGQVVLEHKPRELTAIVTALGGLLLLLAAGFSLAWSNRFA